LKHIYPEHEEKIMKARKYQRSMAEEVSANDVIFIGKGGPCPGWGKNKLNVTYFQDHFRGTVLWFNTEPSSKFDQRTIPSNQIHVGYLADGCQTVRLFPMAIFFARNAEIWDFFGANGTRRKPTSTRERFLLYTQGHCVAYREAAFDALARSHPSLILEHGGSCKGKVERKTNVRSAKKAMGGVRNFNNNWKQMRQYRFCLVMENTKLEGYITEKIMYAFAAGCIPIYYGSLEIYDVFNAKSFIYYDVDNPAPALAQISRLESNASAYDAVMAEPILADGDNTLQKYFSVSDDIVPDAMLKKKIRQAAYYRCKR